MKSHDRCVGADDAEYVYRVTLKIQTIDPGRKGSFFILSIFENGNLSSIHYLNDFLIRKILLIL